MSDSPRYRRLYANQWHDPALRRLNDAGRVVRLYVGAGPQTTSVGCFRLSTAVAVEDLGGTPEAFEERLEVVCAAFGWEWDPVARVVWIPDWFDWNPPASPNVVHAWAKLLRNVPDCDIKTRAIASINSRLKDLPASFREPWRELLKTFSGSESKPQVRSETNQGSGDSGIQRSGSKRTGALRAVAVNKEPDGPTPTARMLTIAREVIRQAQKSETGCLVDAFLYLCRREGLDADHDLAVVALAQSQQSITA